jgi:hypothetical protein
MKTITSIALLLLLFSCTGKQNEDSDPTSISVSNALDNMQDTYLSRFVDSVTYIQLESSEKSLINVQPVIELTEDFIVIRNWVRGQAPLILLFDRKTGKFLREIGRIGRGPDEYLNVPYLYFNQSQKIIYTTGSNDNILTYDLQGEKKDNFKISAQFSTEVEGFPDTFSNVSFQTYLDSNNFVSYVQNYTGNEKKKLVVFDKDTIIKIFPNYLSWERTPSRNISVVTPTFYRFDNRLFFKETFNDTVFEVKNYELIPHFVFSFGKYGIPYARQNEYITLIKSGHTMTVNSFTENKHYFFFTIFTADKSYLSYYDKKKKSLHVCKGNDPRPSSIIDDINDFLPITKFHSNERNELISYFDALSIRNWIDDNPEKARLLANKYPWLKDFEESGNPVIMIAKCKN